MKYFLLNNHSLHDIFKPNTFSQPTGTVMFYGGYSVPFGDYKGHIW